VKNKSDLGLFCLRIAKMTFLGVILCEKSIEKFFRKCCCKVYPHFNSRISPKLS